MKICPSCKTDYPGGEVFCPNDGARLVTASQFDGVLPDVSVDPLIGTVLNERYSILRQIGEGGMGLVYEAEHVAIEKRVALKVLRDDFSGRPEVVQRFKQEAKSASRIGNDHIVDISDFGETPRGASYFVMELLEGEDLAEVLQREQVIDLGRAVDIMLQCCTALAAAHNKGIVHRDMKPENIFLTTKDERPDFVKIVDFGIAKMSDIETEGAPGRKLTKTGMIFGTPEYMSPEQAAGKELDHRVDIYALAVILFEMLTGRVPFVGDTFMGILTQHMFEDPPEIAEVNPHAAIPETVVQFIWKGLAKEADDRYQTCAEMAAALQGAVAGQRTGAPTYVGYGDPTGRHTHKLQPVQGSAELQQKGGSRVWIGVVAALALLAAGGAGAAYYLGQDPASDDIISTDLTPARDAGLVIADPPRRRDAGPEELLDAGRRTVTVTVNTSPAGARVWVEGRGEVCTPTPCSFETRAEEMITVRARVSRSEGEVQITPAESTAIQLELRRTRSGRRRTRPGAGASGRRSGTGRNDLKTPDIFRSPD